MKSDDTSRQLHDKATRGERLTEAEQTQLTLWYQKQDAEEMTLLAPAAAASPTALQALRSEVEEATKRLLTVTQRIHSLTEENEALRRDIAGLSQQLIQSAAPQVV